MKQVRQLEVRIHSHCADKSALPQNSCISYSMQIPKLLIYRLPSQQTIKRKINDKPPTTTLGFHHNHRDIVSTSPIFRFLNQITGNIFNRTIAAKTGNLGMRQLFVQTIAG